MWSTISSDKKNFISLAVVLFLAITLFGAYFAYTNKRSNIVIKYADGSEHLDFGPLPALSYPDFFKQVKEEFISSGDLFVEADLSAMTLKVYSKGEVIKEVPIKTKGKKGSWWETPAGLYKIETKKTEHFSSFGKVYQPWSMSFQGNFFIHGWPYYPDGTPVSSTYSGGCIRLADEDAKAIYDLVSVGTPVLIFEKYFASDGFVYEANKPAVVAKSYLVADLKNSSILTEKNAEESLPIASITKLVTALTSAEYINMDKDITVTKDMVASTSVPRLSIGQNVKAFHLLYPLLMESSNEAATAFSKTVGEKYFVSLMEKKVRALGMKDTQFEDSSGSGAGNVSSARDLLALSRYIYNNRSFVFDISTGNVNDVVYGKPPFVNLQNFNVGAGEPSFIGGKIGKTTVAKETTLSVFDVNIRGVKRPLVFIIIGSENVTTDMYNLRTFVENTYR